MVLVSMGCSGSSSYEIPDVFHVQQCTPEVQKQVIDGMAWARMHIPILFSSSVEFDGGGVYPEQGQIRLTGGGGGQAHGCAITCGIDEDLPQCIAHELGHCAGMHHVETPGALMYWKLPDELVWTDADERECKEHCK